MLNMGDDVVKHHAVCQPNHLTRPLRVKVRRTQYEYMSSALPLNSDIARRSRHFAFGPDADFAPRDWNVNLIGAVQLARVREILARTLGSEARRSETA
jgi:hypothetical protein